MSEEIVVEYTDGTIESFVSPSQEDFAREDEALSKLFDEFAGVLDSVGLMW